MTKKNSSAARLKNKNSKKKQQKKDIESLFETSLDKIRSASLKMHNSSQLLGIIELFFKELQSFEATPLPVTIGVFNEGEKMVELTSKLQLKLFTQKVPIDEPYIMKKIIANRKSGKTIAKLEIKGKRLQSFRDDCKPFSKISLYKVSKNTQYLSLQGVFFSKGIILYSGVEKLPEERINTLKKFAKVLDLIYARFRDLQTKEALLRETVIEAALERVRVKTMAMHSSQDVGETVHTMFREMNGLGLGALRCGISIIQDAHKLEVWTANPADKGKVTLTIGTFDVSIHPKFGEIYNAWKQKKSLYTYELKGKSLVSYFTALNNAPGYPVRYDISKLPEKQISHCFFFKEGVLFVFTATLLSEASSGIFKRFAALFGQTYRRYLDLQKAEAQAREAQIEAALERVRSRSMAMHKSDELKEVIQVVFEQLLQLNFKADSANFSFEDKSTDDVYAWVATAQQAYPILIHIPYIDNPIFNKPKEAKEKGLDFISASYSFEEKNAFWRHFFRHVSVPKDRQQYLLNTPGYASSTAGMDSFSLTVINYHGDSFSDAENAILIRFAKVFNQSYTRFLDLQKAEAQARESQIQLALERVRARTMAMHNSSDLGEVAVLLFEQIKHLGIETYASGFNIWDQEQKNLVSWMSNPTGSINPPFEMPIQPYEQHQRIYDTWKNHEAFLVDDIKGDAIIKHYQFLRSFPLLDQAFNKAEAAGIKTPDRQVHNVAFFSQGYLLFITLEPHPEFKDIFVRFARVFEQTYTRFLDLQKAEEQAREAQIEASLERVRSKTMAMHNSHDVGETVAAMFAEFVYLGMHTNRCGILIFRDETFSEVWTAKAKPGGGSALVIGSLNLKMHLLLDSVYNAWKAGNSFYQYDMIGDDLISYYQSINDQKDYLLKFDLKALPSKEFHSDFFFPEGAVFAFTDEPIAEEHSKIFKRFAGVFGQTYRRYLDLVKAEAQAREAQVEAGLERVRSRAMAMHNSNDLSATANVIFTELNKLGIKPIRSGVGLVSKENHTAQIYSATSTHDGNQFAMMGEISLSGHIVFENQYECWLRKENYTTSLSGKELSDYYKILSAGLKTDLNIRNEGRKEYGYWIMFTEGFLYVWSEKKFSEPEINILERFKNVVELTFRRYIDLQKAEAQAREAEIQLALERVRARTMAMQQSDDLAETSFLMAKQIRELGIEAWGCGFHIYADNEDGDYEWFSTEEGYLTFYKTPREKFYLRFHEKHQSGETLYVEELKGKACANHYRYLMTIPVVGDSLRKLRDSGVAFPTSQIDHIAYFKYGYLLFVTYEPAPEAYEIFKRFAKEFEQTYTRFLDLQKAEAQAREAQIEAALERVRSAAMAMHSSEGLSQVTIVLREQIALLGEKELESILIHIYSEDADEFEAWYSYRHPEDLEGKIVNGRQVLDWSNTARARMDKEKYYSHENDYTIIADYKMLKEWYEYLFSVVPVVVKTNDKGEIVVPEVLYYNYSKISGGALLLITNSEASEQSKNLLNRAAKVFNLAYARFLDLKKAEAQAREAQIEAALERVRAKALAMHASGDLNETIAAFYHELELFSLTPRRCGVGLVEKETRISHLSVINKTEHGNIAESVGKLKLAGHPVLDAIYDSWVNQTEYHPVLRGREIKEYYDSIRTQIAIPEYPNDAVQYGYFFQFSEGGVYTWTEKEMEEDELQIFRRFTSVLGLAYKRYKDLQQAEASAKEAVKQSALDRIRADIASMRTVSDLDRITPLIWNELTILGISFIRCGVFIMDDERQVIHTFLSTPEGKAIASFPISYNSRGKPGLIMPNWKNNTTYVDHWNDSDFVDFANSLVQQGVFESADQYLVSVPHGGFYLHFFPFLQGMLYVGNTERLQKDALSLVESVADAFAAAYSRYEDFKKLEAAKKQVDRTLNELQATQKQLIQSEKMASLGELTAGIAHEIQNPLNFVNNFSEVNKELLAEMTEEIERGHYEEAKTIALNVTENEEKINHHGKRAGSIVRGMLQHSRTSSGQKELTDINVLCDEYLRLSYHGLRAKDKTFNAKFETSFDPDIPKINVVTQDIGRVILNLINNAFYAVSEKEKQRIAAYEPTITITTKFVDNTIEIRVQDNGSGIPEKIRDKIFQPFFTTKPTGQGTGLGLSLSYDIIKAHGGNIKVESKEGEGTEFITQLPTA